MYNRPNQIAHEEQSGFRKGNSWNDNITIVGQLLEKCREYYLETHIGFIDYEKAFNWVNRSDRRSLL